MDRRTSLAWLLAISVVAAPGSTRAHPHAFVVYSVVLPLTPQGVDRVGFVFTFDPLFSATILRDPGQDDAASRPRSDTRILGQLPFEIEITFNDVPVVLEPPTDLQITTDGGQVTYRFVIPLQILLPPPGTIEIRVDDPGFFLAFSLRGADPVEIQTSGDVTATCSRAQLASGAPGPIRCEYKASS
jgi:ABC-type uncharacterized transport system substrate-binding protein